MDGDPLDVCSIAAFVALNCAKVPEVQLRGKAGLEDNFEIVGDMEKSKNLNCAHIPICITLAKVCSDSPVSVDAYRLCYVALDSQ